VLLSVRRRRRWLLPEPWCQADPRVTQCGRRRACAAPCAMEKLGQSEGGPPFYHGIEGPSQRVGQDRQRLALAGVLLSAGPRRLACRVGAQAQDRRFRAGSLEIGVPDLRARGARALAGGFLDTCDEPAVGHAILSPREASAGMDGRQEHETPDLA
jgi:hypothetical protein